MSIAPINKHSDSSWELPSKQLALASDEVHVWRIGLDLDSVRVQTFRDLLSPDERERAEQYRFLIHRQRYIVGRGVVRTLLGRYLTTRPEMLRFSYGPHGKPALADESAANGLRFNLAHTEDLALLAFARNREVGVDVERIERKLSDDKIPERFFSPNEVAALRALPVELQQEGFFNCWTRKEAFIKAKGKGLSLPLNQFDVTLAPGEPAKLLATRGGLDEASKWKLETLSPRTGFVGAVIAEGNDWRLRCWDWK